jgi:hypothetical protein
MLSEQKLVYIVIHNIDQMHNYALREYWNPTVNFPLAL